MWKTLGISIYSLKNIDQNSSTPTLQYSRKLFKADQWTLTPPRGRRFLGHTQKYWSTGNRKSDSPGKAILTSQASETLSPISCQDFDPDIVFRILDLGLRILRRGDFCLNLSPSYSNPLSLRKVMALLLIVVA